MHWHRQSLPAARSRPSPALSVPRRRERLHDATSVSWPQSKRFPFSAVQAVQGGLLLLRGVPGGGLGFPQGGLPKACRGVGGKKGRAGLLSLRSVLGCTEGMCCCAKQPLALPFGPTLSRLALHRCVKLVPTKRLPYVSACMQPFCCRSVHQNKWLIILTSRCL